jgi:hypothetical protein
MGSGKSVCANFYLWFSVILLVINVEYKVMHKFSNRNQSLHEMKSTKSVKLKLS